MSQLIFLPVKIYLESESIRNVGFKELGLYQFMISLQVYVVFLISMVSNPVISYLNMKGLGDREEKLNNNFTLFFSVITCAVLLVCENFVFNYLGDDYCNIYKASYIYKSSVIIILIMSYKTSFFRIIALKAKTLISLFSNLIWMVIVLVSYFFIFNNQGIVIKLVSSFLLGFLINLIYLITYSIISGLIKFNSIINLHSVLLIFIVLLILYIN